MLLVDQAVGIEVRCRVARVWDKTGRLARWAIGDR